MFFRSCLTSFKFVVAEDIVMIMYLTVMIVQNHQVTAVKANITIPILNIVSKDVTPNINENADTIRKNRWGYFCI